MAIIVLISTKVMSSNIAHGEVYSIKHYVIKFFSDVWQVGGFLRVVPDEEGYSRNASCQLNKISTFLLRA
jgi:hypothetical protein